MPTAMFPSMVASYNTPKQVLLVKAVYWAESLSDAVGGTPGTAVYDTMSARYNDPEQVLLVKLVYWLESASSGTGGGGGFPLIPGVGSPQGVVTPAGAGQRYYDTNAFVFYTNTDGTINGWVEG